MLGRSIQPSWWTPAGRREQKGSALCNLERSAVGESSQCEHFHREPVPPPHHRQALSVVTWWGGTRWNLGLVYPEMPLVSCVGIPTPLLHWDWARFCREVELLPAEGRWLGQEQSPERSSTCHCRRSLLSSDITGRFPSSSCHHSGPGSE